jgi:hypothetical protein
MGQNDPWRVDLLSVYAYRTGLLSDDGIAYAGEPPNLFSLVYRFEKVRQRREDPSGLGSRQKASVAGAIEVSTRQTTTIDEVQLATKMASCVERFTLDVDCVMQGDPAAHEALSSECESLLAVRYYSREAYRNWVARLPRIRC